MIKTKNNKGRNNKKCDIQVIGDKGDIINKNGVGDKSDKDKKDDNL